MTKKERNRKYRQALENLSSRSCYGICGVLYNLGFHEAYHKFKDAPEIALFIKEGSTEEHPFGDDLVIIVNGERELEPVRRIILDFAIAMTEE